MDSIFLIGYKYINYIIDVTVCGPATNLECVSLNVNPRLGGRTNSYSWETTFNIVIVMNNLKYLKVTLLIYYYDTRIFYKLDVWINYHFFIFLFGGPSSVFLFPGFFVDPTTLHIRVDLIVPIGSLASISINISNA